MLPFALKAPRRTVGATAVAAAAIAAGAGAVSREQHADPNDYGDLFLIRPDGSGLQHLTKTRDEDTYPAWSGNGRRIAFQRAPRNASNANDIWTIRADGRGPRRLVVDQGWDNLVTFSRDGKRFLYVNHTASSTGLYVATAAGGGKTKLVEQAVPFFLTFPSWSPDGKTILFNRGRNDGRFAIWSIASTGGEETELGMGFRPRWSPDGARILYQSDGKLWVMRADGGQARSLAAASVRGYSDWSRDGRSVVYEYRGGIYVVSSAGGRGRRVARRGRWPVWAPDSRRILFRDPSRNYTLFIADRSGGPPRSLGVTVQQWATWSPDGRWIAFDAAPARVRAAR